jgi:aspartyl-tRNA(Asn)/glutamyl-tRNA(Gln) amidotransferase subunit A
MVLGAIAGADPHDPLCSTQPVPDYRSGLTLDLQGVRLGLVREMAFPEGVHPEVRAALERALAELSSLGATIEEVSLPRAKYSVPLQLLTSDADIAAMFVHKWLKPHWHDIDVGTRQRLGAAALIPATVYARANRARVLVRREVLDACRRFDALIAATSLSPPGLIDAARETVASKEDMATKVILRRIGTYPFSMANVPALAVPMGFSSKGLPLSLQIAAKPFDEPMVFRVAHAYERATNWHQVHPVIDGSIDG